MTFQVQNQGYWRVIIATVPLLLKQLSQTFTAFHMQLVKWYEVQQQGYNDFCQNDVLLEE